MLSATEYPSNELILCGSYCGDKTSHTPFPCLFTEALLGVGHHLFELPLAVKVVKYFTDKICRARLTENELPFIKKRWRTPILKLNDWQSLSLIHISEPTRRTPISY